MLREIVNYDDHNLAAYLRNSIEKICEYLDIGTRIIFSSEIEDEVTLRAQDRIIDICERLHATEYINAIGGTSLYQKEAFRKHGIELSFLEMDYFEYLQGIDMFQPSLSIIDILMNCSREEIKEQLHCFSLK